MFAYRLPNGNLLVPARAEGPDGIIGDGMVEVAPGSPEYREWADDPAAEIRPAPIMEEPGLFDEVTPRVQTPSPSPSPSQSLLFGFFREDRDLVTRIEARVRLLLRRKNITAAKVHGVAVMLLALEHLPLAMREAAIGLSLSRRCGNEMSYRSLYIDQDSFRLDSGGSVYSPEVGGDNYGDTVFEAALGGLRDEPDWMQVATWLEDFHALAGDAESEIDFEMLDNEECEWDAENASEKLWAELPSGRDS